MRYLVQERIFSFTADFWIEDEDGNRVFFVDGKALSLRETFELRDASGQLRALIRKIGYGGTGTLITTEPSVNPAASASA